jgi:hypothetical protein
MGYERSTKNKAMADMEKMSFENGIFIQKLVFLLANQRLARKKTSLKSDWL